MQKYSLNKEVACYQPFWRTTFWPFDKIRFGSLPQEKTFPNATQCSVMQQKRLCLFYLSAAPPLVWEFWVFPLVLIEWTKTQDGPSSVWFSISKEGATTLNWAWKCSSNTAGVMWFFSGLPWATIWQQQYEPISFLMIFRDCPTWNFLFYFSK